MLPCEPELASVLFCAAGGRGKGFLPSAGEESAPVKPGRGCLRGEMRCSSLLLISECGEGSGLLARSDSPSAPSLVTLLLLVARGLFAALPNEGRRVGSDLLCRLETFFTQSDLGCKISLARAFNYSVVSLVYVPFCLFLNIRATNLILGAVFQLSANIINTSRYNVCTDLTSLCCFIVSYSASIFS